VLLGIGWLLEALDVADVPWRAILPATLVVVGVVLIVGSRTARHGGIIALGGVLTAAVLLSSAIAAVIDVPFTGGVGQKTQHVTGAPDSEYRWALGSLTLDLSAVDLAGGDATVEASVAIGELVVVVPDGVAVHIDAGAGLGQVTVLGRKSDGVHPSLEADLAGDGAALVLDLNVGVGSLEVRR